VRAWGPARARGSRNGGGQQRRPHRARALTRARKPRPPSPTNCVGEGVYFRQPEARFVDGLREGRAPPSPTLPHKLRGGGRNGTGSRRAIEFSPSPRGTSGEGAGGRGPRGRSVMSAAELRSVGNPTSPGFFGGGGRGLRARWGRLPARRPFRRAPTPFSPSPGAVCRVRGPGRGGHVGNSPLSPRAVGRIFLRGGRRARVPRHPQSKSTSSP
jgi:hypothetical protein